MDNIHDEAESILRKAQVEQQLEAKIEAQRRVIDMQQKLIDALCKQGVVFANLVFPGAVLDPANEACLKRCQEEVPDVKTCATRLFLLFDQLDAAREELRALEEPDH